MYLEEEIRRKIRIRKDAYKNMVGEGESYDVIKLGEKDKEKLRKKIYLECTQLDEYKCNKVYSEVIGGSRLAVFIKKVLRRMFYKVMGWYYVPIIEGQIDYNRQVKALVNDLQHLVDSQQEEIKELYNQLRDV